MNKLEPKISLSTNGEIDDIDLNEFISDIQIKYMPKASSTVPKASSNEHINKKYIELF